MGVSTSGLVHRTIKCVIQVLTCWNRIQHALYCLTKKFGYFHEWVKFGVRELCWNNFDNNDGAKESRIILEF